MPEQLDLFFKPGWSKCDRARSFLLEHGVPFGERNLASQPLSVEELDSLIGDRPVAPFLHPGSALYQEREMDKHPPSRAEAIRLMAEDPNLILRPLVRSGERLVARPDEATLAEMAGVSE